MASTSLSHSDITSKFDPFDPADSEEEGIEIETEEGDASDEEEEFEIVEKTVPDLDEPVPAAETPDVVVRREQRHGMPCRREDAPPPVPDQEDSMPADEVVSPDAAPVVQPAKADQRCIEQKQHVPNCECTGSARSPF